MEGLTALHALDVRWRSMSNRT